MLSSVPLRVNKVRRSGVQAFGRSGGIHRDEQDEQDERGPDINRHLVFPGNPVHPVYAGAGPERLNPPASGEAPPRRLQLKQNPTERF